MGNRRPGDPNRQLTQSFEIAPKDQYTYEGAKIQTAGSGSREGAQTPQLDKIIVPAYAVDGRWEPPSKQIVLLSEAERWEHARAAAEASKYVGPTPKSARQLDLSYGLPARKRCRSALRAEANAAQGADLVKKASQAGVKRSKTCPAMP